MRARSLQPLAFSVAVLGGGIAAAPPADPVKPVKPATAPSSRAPIAEAAQRGNLIEVRQLIAQGSDVNAPQGDGMTALHWAAERGDSAMTLALVRAKADAKARTRLADYTPLHLAARGGNAAATRVLLAAGADVRATTIGGATPLHLAAEAGNPDVVKALIAKGADANARESVWGQTPLIFAAERDRAAAITALMKGGADASIHTTVVNVTEQAAREQAAEKKRNAVLITFEPKARKDSADADYQKALAAARANLAALGGAGAGAGGRGGAPGAPAAGGAAPAAQGTAAAVAAAAAAATPGTPVYPAHTTSAGSAPTSSTPRDSAVTTVNAPTAASAASAAAVPNAAPATGASPSTAAGANLAAGFGRGLPVRMPRGPFTTQQIQAAIDSGRAILLAPKVTTDSVRENVDTANGGVAGYGKQVGKVGGLTALHHAARQGNVAAAEALIAGGANVNDTAYVDRMTPLLVATMNGQFDVAMKLIEGGADPNVTTPYGMTPLYATINAQWAPKSRYPQVQAIATQRTGYVELAEALLKKGAKPNDRLGKQPWWFVYNNCGSGNCGLEQLDGTTAFWRAAYALDVDLMKLLAKFGAEVNTASIPPRAIARGGGLQPTPGTVAPAPGAGGAPATAADSAARQTRRAAATAAAGSTATRADSGRAQAAGGRPAGGAPSVAAIGAGLGDGLTLKLDPEVEAMAKVAPVGSGVFPIHAAAGVGYGNGFAGNAHRHAPEAWMSAMRYMVEELKMDVNARDNNGYTPLHHAASRGDNEMIKYLVSKGADVKAVSRTGRTVVDMANGPVQRLRPFPETIELLEKLGAKNQHLCVSC